MGFLSHTICFILNKLKGCFTELTEGIGEILEMAFVTCASNISDDISDHE